jgi:hypothetical protein
MIIQSTPRIESWTLVLCNKGMCGLLLDFGMELSYLLARYAVKGFCTMLEHLKK